MNTTPTYIICRRNVVTNSDWKITGLWFGETCPEIIDTNVIDDLPTGEISNYDVAIFRVHLSDHYKDAAVTERKPYRFEAMGQRSRMIGGGLGSLINSFSADYF
jgi:5,10-methenyltetrahydromethanopterin hydrogenase